MLITHGVKPPHVSYAASVKDAQELLKAERVA